MATFERASNWPSWSERTIEGDRGGPFVAASFSVVMLAWTEVSQRTAKEYQDMLRDVGFVDARVDPAFGYWSIVSARKPG